MKIAVEAILTLLVVVIALLAPLLIGMALYRGYRAIKPMEEVEVNHITDIDKVGDRFFLKSIIIGWAICGPIYYWLLNGDMF